MNKTHPDYMRYYFRFKPIRKFPPSSFLKFYFRYKNKDSIFVWVKKSVTAIQFIPFSAVKNRVIRHTKRCEKE